jgi:hypothetical protein
MKWRTERIIWILAITVLAAIIAVSLAIVGHDHDSTPAPSPTGIMTPLSTGTMAFHPQRAHRRPPPPGPSPQQAWEDAGGRKRDRLVSDDIDAIQKDAIHGFDGAPLREAVWDLYYDSGACLRNLPPRTPHEYAKAMGELHSVEHAASDSDAETKLINGITDMPDWVWTSTI